jgi:hypothetical protein
MKVDSSMSTSVRDEILELIGRAQAAREMALRDENRSGYGYPYAAGHAIATLSQIQRLVARL